MFPMNAQCFIFVREQRKEPKPLPEQKFWICGCVTLQGLTQSLRFGESDDVGGSLISGHDVLNPRDVLPDVRVDRRFVRSTAAERVCVCVREVCVQRGVTPLGG